jgi:23S rRNA (cytosine1962-C5)-methyltransferase
VRRAEFLEAVTSAAQDSGRTLVLLEHLGQGSDHPEVMTVPETGYLKGVVLRASD